MTTLFDLRYQDFERKKNPLIRKYENAVFKCVSMMDQLQKYIYYSKENFNIISHIIQNIHADNKINKIVFETKRNIKTLVQGINNEYFDKLLSKTKMLVSGLSGQIDAAYIIDEHSQELSKYIHNINQKNAALESDEYRRLIDKFNIECSKFKNNIFKRNMFYYKILRSFEYIQTYIVDGILNNDKFNIYASSGTNRRLVGFLRENFDVQEAINESIATLNKKINESFKIIEDAKQKFRLSKSKFDPTFLDDNDYTTSYSELYDNLRNVLYTIDNEISSIERQNLFKNSVNDMVEREKPLIIMSEPSIITNLATAESIVSDIKNETDTIIMFSDNLKTCMVKSGDERKMCIQDTIANDNVSKNDIIDGINIATKDIILSSDIAGLSEIIDILKQKLDEIIDKEKKLGIKIQNQKIKNHLKLQLGDFKHKQELLQSNLNELKRISDETVNGNDPEILSMITDINSMNYNPMQNPNKPSHPIEISDDKIRSVITTPVDENSEDGKFIKKMNILSDRLGIHKTFGGRITEINVSNHIDMRKFKNDIRALKFKFKKIYNEEKRKINNDSSLSPEEKRKKIYDMNIQQKKYIRELVDSKFGLMPKNSDMVVEMVNDTIFSHLKKYFEINLKIFENMSDFVEHLNKQKLLRKMFSHIYSDVTRLDDSFNLTLDDKITENIKYIKQSLIKIQNKDESVFDNIDDLLVRMLVDSKIKTQKGIKIKTGFAELEQITARQLTYIELINEVNLAIYGPSKYNKKHTNRADSLINKIKIITKSNEYYMYVMFIESLIKYIEKNGNKYFNTILNIYAGDHMTDNRTEYAKYFSNINESESIKLFDKISNAARSDYDDVKNNIEEHMDILDRFNNLNKLLPYQIDSLTQKELIYNIEVLNYLSKQPKTIKTENKINSIYERNIELVTSINLSSGTNFTILDDYKNKLFVTKNKLIKFIDYYCNIHTKISKLQTQFKKLKYIIKQQQKLALANNQPIFTEIYEKNKKIIEEFEYDSDDITKRIFKSPKTLKASLILWDENKIPDYITDFMIVDRELLDINPNKMCVHGCLHPDILSFSPMFNRIKRALGDTNKPTELAGYNPTVTDDYKRIASLNGEKFDEQNPVELRRKINEIDVTVNENNYRDALIKNYSPEKL